MTPSQRITAVIAQQNWNDNSLAILYRRLLDTILHEHEIAAFLEEQAKNENENVPDNYPHLTADQKGKLISIAIEVEMAGDGETKFSAKEAAEHVDGLTVYEMLERMGYWEVGDLGATRDRYKRRFGFDPETGAAYP
jgi:hypothetical protein